MTDNQIIKALPKILYGGHGCKKCKYYMMVGDERCGLKGCYIARQALDLINYLMEENEVLTKRLRHLLKSDTIKQYDEYDRKTHTYKRDISKFDIEIEERISKAKSEARKEFAEQLEAEIISSDKYIREYDDSEVQKAYNKGLRDALNLFLKMR